MRTTVDLAPALLRRLRDEAHRRGVPLKSLLTDVLERGLAPRQVQVHKRPVLPTAALGGVRAGVNLDRALSLAQAIEDDDLLRNR